jgi:hypothetical protein
MIILNVPENIPDSWKIEKRLQHPAFPQPSDPMVRVWRYMTLPKFIWQLKQQQLYLTRLDRLEDSFEGSLTSKTIEGVELFLRQRGVKEDLRWLSEQFRRNREITYVCCWHENQRESEAMWRLYCGQAHGVAIQTTYRHLVDAIDTQYEMYVGLVKYIDYDRESFPSINVYLPAMHKRIAFEHEREIRLFSSPFKLHEPNHGPAPNAVFLPWDNDLHIERVFVDPYAPEYFYDAVETVIENLAPYLKTRLMWSQMKAAPFF